MTVSAIVPANFPARLVGNGVTTVFPFLWKINAVTDLNVYLSSTLKTYGTDYTVSGVGLDAGGSVIFGTPPGNGIAVTIARAIDQTRTTDYQAHGDFLESTVDPDFDKPVLMIQDLNEKISRALQSSVTDPLTSTTIDKTSFSGQFLAVSAGGALIPSSGTGADSGLRSDLANTTTAGKGNELVSYRRTPAEISTGVTPVNYYIPSHDVIGYVIVDRYGTNTIPGTTDMSSAIIAAQKVAFTGSSVSGIGDHAKVKFLRGIYRIQTDSIFTQAYSTSGFQRGIVYEGEGLASTKLLLITGGSAKYFYKNTSASTQQFIFVTYRDLMFVTDSTTNGNGWYFQQEQGYVWERCWFQTFARVIEGNGSDTGSEHNLIKCKGTEIYDRFISFNNNQMLNICLFGCDIENVYGHCFYVGAGGGGRLLVQGGSYILDDGGSKHWLLYLDGGGLGGNDDCYTFEGIQTELHTTNTGLVFKGTEGTQCIVEFLSCNQTSTGGARDIIDIRSGRVVFRGGRVTGTDTYKLRTTGVITWPRAGETASVHFENTGVPANLSSLITTDTYGFASARNCHYDAYEPAIGNAARYAVDFDLNWDNMARGYMFPGLKTVCFKIGQGDWPYTGDGGANDWTVTLPNNAKIKNIYVLRPANAGGGAANIQLAVGNGDKTTTYGTSTLAAGTAEHFISVEKALNLLISAGTTNPNNQVRIWGATTNNSVVQGGYAIVQYY